jgi:anaphase-promoting complex subunit 1
MFDRFFSVMQTDWSPAKFVEALFAAGVDLLVLETLPEAVLAPLQEAIVQCQNEPPTSWSKDLLAIVGREDVNTLLAPGKRPRNTQTAILVRARYSIDVLILTEAGAISRSKPGCPLHLLVCRR